MLLTISIENNNCHYRRHCRHITTTTTIAAATTATAIATATTTTAATTTAVNLATVWCWTKENLYIYPVYRSIGLTNISPPCSSRALFSYVIPTSDANDHELSRRIHKGSGAWSPVRREARGFVDSRSEHPCCQVDFPHVLPESEHPHRPSSRMFPVCMNSISQTAFVLMSVQSRRVAMPFSADFIIG